MRRRMNRQGVLVRGILSRAIMGWVSPLLVDVSYYGAKLQEQLARD